MAAKSKKRLSKIENKPINLEKLELKDVLCSICQSILIEPVTLPCFHDFCQLCFNGSIKNNALCCPLCRLRIGSWLRTATKQKNLVNLTLWQFIKTKFSREIDIKTNGGDVCITEEITRPRLSKPGEIRLEYEAELQRLRAERLKLEEKHIQETEILIRNIQEEEEEAHRKYLECLKKDEMLAHQLSADHLKKSTPPYTTPKKNIQSPSRRKSRLRPTKIDSYLSKIRQSSTIKDCLSQTEETTSESNEVTSKISTANQINDGSPEMVPSYGKIMKNIVDKKSKAVSCLWNKENGESQNEKSEDNKCHKKDLTESTEVEKSKTKLLVPSLLVSLPLPYTGIRSKNAAATENRAMQTGSVDSMHQELCYFKPIEGKTPTSSKKGLPIRVPGLKAETAPPSPHYETPPSRAQYLQGLCRLRNISIAKKLPSAFAIALNLLKIQKETPVKCETSIKQRVTKISTTSPTIVPPIVAKKTSSRSKAVNQIDGISALNIRTNLRRTRSMGSITKDENETTPKKAKVKQRKVLSERKPYLRSDSKRNNVRKCSPVIDLVNSNKVNVAVKNLSSPLENCDVKKILEEQLRIEKLIEQEKSDLELARKMDAEWNGRRQLRRAAGKRQLTLSNHLRPAKKLKV